MNVTTEQIENELIDFFNPFVYIAVEEEKTEGGFDIRPWLHYEDGGPTGTNKLKFIIFDRKWEDDNKKEIWSETVDVSKYDTLLALKCGVAPIIEKSIRIFCEQ